MHISNRLLRSGLLVGMAPVAALLLLFSLSATSQSRYISFDPPGATYTYPSSINLSGQIVGGYGDSVGGHSFLRNTDGSIVSFDPAGATFSTAASINTSGEITGYFYDSAGTHGYYRSAAGDITAFDVGSIGQYRTFPSSINDSGLIVGSASDLNGYQAWVRDRSGAITIFNPPGSVSSFAETINQSGVISGVYYDSTGNVLHAYIRSVSGALTIVNVPGAMGQGTISGVLNNKGDLVGTYMASKTSVVSNK